MRRQMMFRLSKTAYGKKLHLRLGMLNLYSQGGFPPWAKYWTEPIQWRKIKGGYRSSFLWGGYTLQLRVQWWNFDSTRKVERWLECPDCGYTNKARNFWRRREPPDGRRTQWKTPRTGAARA